MMYCVQPTERSTDFASDVNTAVSHIRTSYLIDIFIGFCNIRYLLGALKMQHWKMQDWILTDQIAGLENAGPENARLESDELRLKQPQTSATIDVSELSQNCVGLLHKVVDVRVHFCSKVPYYRTVPYDSNFFRIGLSAETSEVTRGTNCGLS